VAQFTGAGIAASVPGDATTTFSAKAVDAAGNPSGCSTTFAYTEDSTPPSAPSITATDPASPANDNSPKVKGTAGGGATHVDVWKNGICSGSPDAGGSAADFSGAGIAVSVPGDATTTLSAKSIDAAGNPSGCSSPAGYTEDSTPPDAPAIGGTEPASPGASTSPRIKGTTGAGSPTNVKLWKNGTCSGAVPDATGSPAQFTGSGITLDVSANATTTISAKASDAAGNDSSCSPAVTYSEDATPPETHIDSGPTSSTDDTTPTFAFSASEAGSTFECRVDGAAFAPCESPYTSPALSAGDHNFDVRATDALGNTDQSPARSSFTVHTPPPPPPPSPQPTNGNDTLTGSAGADTICGLLGNDFINGAAGNDILFGDLCNVTAKRLARVAGGGNDKLNGSAGNDRLYGAAGNDRLAGGDGNDELFGGAGADTLSGDAGKDVLDGGAGNDKLTGGAGADTLGGGRGNDAINSRDHRKDIVDCGAGSKDSAIVDKVDTVRHCEKVRRK
jgi:Ca2+-binding RTX toxin-like protein